MTYYLWIILPKYQFSNNNNKILYLIWETMEKGSNKLWIR